MANTFQRAVKADIDATLVDVYVATNKSVVIGLTLTNKLGSSITASAQFVPASGDAPYIIKDVPLPSGSSVEVMAGNKIVMNGTDRIKVKGSATNSVDAILSYMEIT